MKIEKNNLTIRSAEDFDAEILTKWWNDGKIMAHAGFPWQDQLGAWQSSVDYEITYEDWQALAW